MQRRLLVLTFTLLTLTMLSLPQRAASTTTGFCQTCQESCWNEANGDPYQHCRWVEGKSQSECDQVVKQYYNSCITTDCNYAGCSLPLME